MNKVELRTRFDKEISAPDKELLWEQLEEYKYVADACIETGGWAEFKEEADKLARWQWRMLKRAKLPGRTPRDPFYIESELTDLEREHAAALAPYLAKRAALLPEVRAFREEKLGGDTLEPEQEQITAFLRTELGHLFSDENSDLEFALKQVPSYLDGDEIDELMDLVGGHLNRGIESEDRYWQNNFRRAVEFDSMSWSYEPVQQSLRGFMHLICDETGGTLEDLGRWLVSRYPWPLRDAVWFVLTGEPPEVEPLHIQYHRDSGTYTLTFAPWISEKTIRRVYRNLYNRDNSPLGSKTLSLFRFVNDCTEPEQTPKWSEMTRRWNEQHPDDKFTDRSALRRAYKRAEARLASLWVNELGDVENEAADIVDPDVLF